MKIRLSFFIVGVLLNLPHLVQAETVPECHDSHILQAQNCPGDELDTSEQALYELINQYRAQHKLPKIPHSPSLTLVANRHAQDLAKNLKLPTSSWSDCQYETLDPSTWPCMWTAPQRLMTNYPDKAHEIIDSRAYRATPETAFHNWQNNGYYRAMLLNQSPWETPWNALGIAIYKEYAIIWLGQTPDTQLAIDLPTLPPLGKSQAFDPQGYPTRSDSQFLGGLAVEQGPYENRVSVNVTQSPLLTLRGAILPDPAHVGESVDIVLSVLVTLPTGEEQFYLINEQGKTLPWDKKMQNWQPFIKNTLLQTPHTIKLYQGNFDLPSNLHIFFGYRLPNQHVIVNGQPIEFILFKQ